MMHLFECAHGFVLLSLVMIVLSTTGVSCDQIAHSRQRYCTDAGTTVLFSSANDVTLNDFGDVLQSKCCR